MAGFGLAFVTKGITQLYSIYLQSELLSFVQFYVHLQELKFSGGGGGDAQLSYRLISLLVIFRCKNIHYLLLHEKAETFF